MANDLGRNPWFIDTPGANFIRTGTAVSANISSGPGATPNLGKGPAWLTNITWSGYGAATDTVTISDIDGNVIWRLQGKTDKSNVEINFDFPLRIWDFKVATMTSGVLAIHLK